jgi:hypothetical protein
MGEVEPAVALQVGERALHLDDHHRRAELAVGRDRVHDHAAVRVLGTVEDGVHLPAVERVGRGLAAAERDRAPAVALDGGGERAAGVPGDADRHRDLAGRGAGVVHGDESDDEERRERRDEQLDEQRERDGLLAPQARQLPGGDAEALTQGWSPPRGCSRRESRLRPRARAGRRGWSGARR